MPVTRERVDPIRDQADLGLVHRRWILPDDVHRPISLAQVSRLWRGLIDLSVLNAREEVHLERFGREAADIPPVSRICAACRQRRALELPRFGEGVLLEISGTCECGAPVDLGRDKVELRNGAVFLLEELACRAALSIELPRAPQSEELPDAQVASLIGEAFGGTDELADDSVPPAE